jgi:hypothetical protein
MAQIWAVQTDYPNIAVLLERISKDEKKHRRNPRDAHAQRCGRFIARLSRGIVSTGNGGGLAFAGRLRLWFTAEISRKPCRS